MNRCNFEMKTENQKCVSPVTKFFYLLHWSNTLSIEYCDWVHCDAASMWLRAIWISWSVSDTCHWKLTQSDSVTVIERCHVTCQCQCVSMPLWLSPVTPDWQCIAIVTCHCHVTCYCTSHYLLFTKLHSHQLSVVLNILFSQCKTVIILKYFKNIFYSF